MKTFGCEQCGSTVRFEWSTCPVCSSMLGYLPAERTIRQLLPSAHDAGYRVAGGHIEYWRCLNAAWGCNWMLTAATGATWCRSCALTRGRPDQGRPDAIAAWALTEAAKRRLVHQLDRLALPVRAPAGAMSDELVFDLVYLPGERGLTGHLDGVVTLDLAEADPAYRDAQRRQFGEPFRTLLGSLRHEVGHHYWGHLVEDRDDLAAFRSVFGDERADYGSALQRYYTDARVTWDRTRGITRYAQAHPHEDWAETFAHYLHVVDLVDTAAGHGLIAGAAEPGEDLPTPGNATLAELLDLWRPIALAIDDVADAVGAAHIYPFDPAPSVVDKLAYVHSRVTARRPLAAQSSRPRVPPAAAPDDC
jgi:hypothetical protein